MNWCWNTRRLLGKGICGLLNVFYESGNYFGKFQMMNNIFTSVRITDMYECICLI